MDLKMIPNLIIIIRILDIILIIASCQLYYSLTVIAKGHSNPLTSVNPDLSPNISFPDEYTGEDDCGCHLISQW